MNEVMHFETEAPPMTRMALSSPVIVNIFRHLVSVELAHEAAANAENFRPLNPNFIKVIPYLTPDKAMRYMVNTAVNLAESGKLQVRDYLLETTWTDDQLGIKDSESDTVLLPDLGFYQYTFAALGPIYAIETNALRDPMDS